MRCKKCNAINCSCLDHFSNVNTRSFQKKYNTGLYPDPNNQKYRTKISKPSNLHNITVDNRSRGQVPVSDQPDHTLNMWKTDQSQSGTIQNTTETLTPIRGRGKKGKSSQAKSVLSASKFESFVGVGEY
jgi:hypothetical protein